MSYRASSNHKVPEFSHVYFAYEPFAYFNVEATATAISPEEVEKLTKEISELKTQHDGVLDKYRRSIAENDNMRKRLTKQIEDAKIFGIQGKQKGGQLNAQTAQRS